MFANDIGISPKIKKGLLSMEKDIPKCEKIKVCQKLQKRALSYQFIQINVKISFLKKA